MPLSRTDTNWLVSDSREGNKFSYELNVCRALVTHEQWQCDPFAGACQVINSTESDVTLGYIGTPAVETTPDNEPLLVLKFQGGVHNRSARIEFMCPLDVHGNPIAGIMGEPTFLYQSNLNYIFSWRTSVACPLGSFPPAVGAGCSVTSPLLNTSYSLLSLSNKTYSVFTGDYDFSLAVCGALPSAAALPSGCIGAGVCQTKPSDPSFYRVAGQPNSTLVFQNNVLQLVMTGGQSCKTGYLRTTRITFLCGVDAGTPQFVAETSTCDYSFVWYTKAACGTPSQSQCVAIDSANGVSYDFSLLSRLSSNWISL